MNVVRKLSPSTILLSANDNCYLYLVHPGQSGSTTLASSVIYMPFGPIASFTYGNGLVRTNTYDEDYRLTGITTSATGANIQNLTIAYDGVNDISPITDNLDSTQTQTFTYDDLYRITEAVGKYGTIDYTYDANGNRLTRTTGGVTQTSTYPSGSNLVSSITNSPTSTRNFTYTANGNIATDSMSGSGTPFTYSNRNRLSESSGNAYLYNALGERVARISGSSTLRYNYDQQGHLIGEISVPRDYIWLDDMPLAQITSGTYLYYIHPDQTNVPQKMTDGSKNIVWDRIQQPFGETYSTTGSATGNLRFPGQFVSDTSTLLYYNWMRDYDRTTGRYIEADPIGLTGTSVANMNLYGYASQNALKYTDPKGLWFGTQCSGNDFPITESPNPTILNDEMSGDSPSGAKPPVVQPDTNTPNPDDEDPNNQKDPNKLTHIFDNPQHNLNNVVNQYGSQEAAFNAIQNAANAVVRAQGLTGPYQVSVQVGGEMVTVRGVVINGYARIGTAYIP